MGKRVSSIFALLVCMPAFVSAQVVITEIMYDLDGSDSGREWVEVQNTSSESVTLTDWKFFEGDTNHGITETNGATLAPGAYAVIADKPEKFKVDWSGFSGLLFDSSFSLKNTGETLVLRCCGSDLSDRDSVTYNNTGGGAGDGFTLHRDGLSITAADPSPGSGAQVVTSFSEPEESEPTESAEPEQVEQPVVEEEKEAPPVVAVAPKPTVIVQEEHEAVPQKKDETTSAVEESDPGGGSEEDREVVEQKPSSLVAAAEGATPENTSPWLWWGGAGALSFIGAASAYVIGRSRRREWDIEEIE